ncbi:MAG: PIN domain-containing protein [Synergistaceae bacterium]|jgi:PIN domain nuclease of toxin-antitoxin system|nr:PIN domain-containing protein [Synergistaceae bacterium]
MIVRYILDACALIALLKDECGAEEVSAIFNYAFKGEALIFMNKINLLEVYYDVYRSADKETADNVVFELVKCPITVVAEISDAVFTEAGRLKATYKISLADSIALAETSVSGGSLVTADHHEFDSIEKRESIRFHWIR